MGLNGEITKGVTEYKINCFYCSNTSVTHRYRKSQAEKDFRAEGWRIRALWTCPSCVAKLKSKVLVSYIGESFHKRFKDEGGLNE